MQKGMTLEDVRFELSEALRDIRAGRIAPINANAISNVSGKLINTIKLEVEIMKLAGQKPSSDLVSLPPAEEAPRRRR